MFAKATNVGFAQRVVATLVACAVVLWSIGVYTTAQAANLTLIKDTLSDSDPGVTSAHTIVFTIPTGSGLDDGDTVTITFAPEFSNVTGVGTGDIIVSANGSVDPHAGFAAGASTISFNSVQALAGQEVIVAIADGIITNPGTIQSYEIVVDTGAAGDTGKTRVAIVDNVYVSAVVQTTFDFVISGLATSTPVNGTSTTGSTTPNTIPFGVLTAGEIKTMAQRLNVTTNSANGYIVTVQQDGNLQSSTGADIDSFIEGSDLDTPAPWASPVPVLGSENTYGHWGLTTTDGNLHGGGIAFTGTDQWIAASTTPRVIMAHNFTSNGTDANSTAAGDDTGETIVGYQIEINSLQEAADDYNTTLTYIATPTF